MIIINKSAIAEKKSSCTSKESQRKSKIKGLKKFIQGWSNLFRLWDTDNNAMMSPLIKDNGPFRWFGIFDMKERIIHKSLSDNKSPNVSKY